MLYCLHYNSDVLFALQQCCTVCTTTVMYCLHYSSAALFALQQCCTVCTTTMLYCLHCFIAALHSLEARDACTVQWYWLHQTPSRPNLTASFIFKDATSCVVTELQVYNIAGAGNSGVIREIKCWEWVRNKPHERPVHRVNQLRHAGAGHANSLGGDPV